MPPYQGLEGLSMQRTALVCISRRAITASSPSLRGALATRQSIYGDAFFVLYDRPSPRLRRTQSRCYISLSFLDLIQESI